MLKQAIIVLATVSFVGQAHASPFCEAFEKVARAGMEVSPFASLKGKGVKGDDQAFVANAKFPGFEQCHITPILSRFECFATGLNAPQGASLEASTKQELETCLKQKMVRDGTISTEPWALRESPGSYPLITLNNIKGSSGSMVYFSLQMKR